MDAPGRRSGSPPSPQMLRWVGLAVFVVALVPRFAYFFGLKDVPCFQFPTVDAEYHVKWATDVATRTFLGDRVFFRAPLYPYFLSFFFWLLGTGRVAFLVVHAVQMVVGAVSCVLLFRICARIHGLPAGAIAGGMAAFTWIFIYFEGELLLPVLLVFLLLCAFWYLVRAVEGGRTIHFLAAGLFVGLFAITRPNILICVPFLLGWILVLARRHATPARGWPSVLALTAGVVLCVAPVTLRNYAVTGDTILVSSEGGLSFYLGNHREADGAHAIMPGVVLDSSWDGDYEVPRELAQAALGRTLKPSEISRYWFERGLHFLAENPGQAARLYFQKLRYLFNVSEISNNQPIEFFVEYVGILDKPFFLGFPLLASLGIAGFLLLPRDRWWWLFFGFATCYLGSFLFFFVCTRYRVPALPIFIAMGAALLVRLVDAARARAWRRLAWAASVVLVVLGVLRINDHEWDWGRPGTPSMGHYVLGSCYANGEMYAEAIPHFQLASFLERPMGTAALLQLGYSLASVGETEEAFRVFRRAVEIHPGHRKWIREFFEERDSSPRELELLSEFERETAGL